MRRPGRRGGAAIEFALVVPVLLSIISGILEFSRYLWVVHSIQSSCEQASQYVYAHSLADVDSLVAMIPDQIASAAAELMGATYSEENLTVTTATSTSAAGVDFISITASYSFSFLGLLELPSSVIQTTIRVPID